MDAITAVSAAARPSLLFHRGAAAGAAGLGFSTDEARRLALDTFAGAVKLAAASSEDAAILVRG